MTVKTYPTADMISAAAETIALTGDLYTVYRYVDDDLTEQFTNVPITVQPITSALVLAAYGNEQKDDYQCFIPVAYDVHKGDVIKIEGTHHLITGVKNLGTHLEATLKITGEADA